MGKRIVPGWSAKPAGRPVRPAGFAILAAGALLAAVPLQPAAASTATVAAAPEQAGARPSWVSQDDARAANRLIALLQSAELDGLDPKSFDVKALKGAVRSAARGNSAAMKRANAM